MEQVLSWEAAVLAAGMTTVYIADEWEHAAEARPSPASDAPKEGASSH